MNLDALSAVARDAPFEHVTHVAHPASRVERVRPEVHLQGASLCRGSVCKPLGKQLLHRLHRLWPETIDFDAHTLDATDNLKLAALSNGEVWRTDQDAPLELKRPSVADARARPHRTIWGDVLLVEWYDSTKDNDEPGYTQITSSNGVVIGPPIAGFITTAQVSDTQLAVAHFSGGWLPSGIQLVDLHSGRRRSPDFPLEHMGEMASIVPLDQDTFAVMYNYALGRNRHDRVRVAIVSHDDDDRGVMGTSDDIFLPRCQ